MINDKNFMKCSTIIRINFRILYCNKFFSGSNKTKRVHRHSGSSSFNEERVLEDDLGTKQSQHSDAHQAGRGR